MPLTCKKCGASFPHAIKIDGKRRVLSNRKFCLTCSPFDRHNTENLCKPTTKHCPMCDRDFPRDYEHFYRRRNDDHSSYCKQCTDKLEVERQRQMKEMYVQYKGGKCEKCGYDRCVAAMDFHHKDPKEKDHKIKFRGGLRSFEKVKRELDKCQLLCATCHRETHWELQSLSIDTTCDLENGSLRTLTPSQMPPTTIQKMPSDPPFSHYEMRSGDTLTI